MIRAPMDPSVIAEHADVACDLVGFRHYGQHVGAGACVWDEAGTIGRSLNRILNLHVLVEECLDDRSTRTCHSRMARTVRGMLWAAFWESHRQQVGTISLINFC